MDRLRQEKVQRFEEFVDRRLKPDLVRAIAERYYFHSQPPLLILFLTILMSPLHLSDGYISIVLRLLVISVEDFAFVLVLTVCLEVIVAGLQWLHGSLSAMDIYDVEPKASSDLRRNIENLEKNSVTNLRTLVNLGSEVYMQADVPDTRYICVDVGLGFHVEFTWPEALNYISAREERQIEDYTRLIASIKAQIKMMMDQDEPQLSQVPNNNRFRVWLCSVVNKNDATNQAQFNDVLGKLLFDIRERAAPGSVRKNDVVLYASGKVGALAISSKKLKPTPITPFELFSEFSHHVASTARINNDKFGSCPASIIAAQRRYQINLIKDLINADHVDEISVFDNATTAVAIVLQRPSPGPSSSPTKFMCDTAVMLHYGYSAVKKYIQPYLTRTRGEVIEVKLL
ncbi:hypothetical protein RJ639_002412 [Escallonia herrerae]|uniref:Uncharacterized protein n=1 Tax=Escallonia herrerae TaxID=1293975 RepID=A0AA88X971_9ASTE|nr:hypothetical protein RJ639_002412 [Escallonia herrerae]